LDRVEDGLRVRQPLERLFERQGVGVRLHFDAGAAGADAQRADCGWWRVHAEAEPRHQLAVGTRVAEVGERLECRDEVPRQDFEGVALGHQFSYS
jgi:hypothetical protein